MKMFDSELKVMDVLWERGDASAKQISAELAETIGWNKNTTYTVIKKCVAKGAIERREPDFVCHALITREQVRKREAEELVDRFFGGSPALLVASLLDGKPRSEAEIEDLKKLVDSMK